MWLSVLSHLLSFLPHVPKIFHGLILSYHLRQCLAVVHWKITPIIWCVLLHPLLSSPYSILLSHPSFYPSHPVLCCWLQSITWGSAQPLYTWNNPKPLVCSLFNSTHYALQASKFSCSQPFEKWCCSYSVIHKESIVYPFKVWWNIIFSSKYTFHIYFKVSFKIDHVICTCELQWIFDSSMYSFHIYFTVPSW